METSCLETGWCDLSEEHRRIRAALEGLLASYVRGDADEYWMPVIVAPYGSGKTTLLRHLEWYAGRIGTRALRVELSDIVEYIIERHGSVHESELPRVLEEYAREKLGRGDGVTVLLVDEVEESYDLLRGVVEYETSPFRGVAEAIRTRSTSVYLVLAFGPSSTLKEAVFGPVAWRSRVFTLPLLPKQVIERMVREKLGDSLGEATDLLANTVWWASKGRIAWARMLVDTVAAKLASALRSGPEKVESLLLGEEALSREIVEGVPLFDKTGYREVRRLVEDKALVPLLAALVGPVPLSLLEKMLGREVLPEASLAVVYSRTAVRVEDLLSEAESWITRYARAKGFQASSVEHAVSALEHVAQAWSRGGLMIYEPQSLRELFSLAADVAREIYSDDPHAAQLIEALSPDLLSPPLERLDEPAAALKPGMVARIYPVASSSPLVGCARRVGPSQVAEVVETLSLSELLDYSAKLSEVLGLESMIGKHGMKLAVLPLRLAQSQARSIACRMLSGERLAVLVVDTRRERREAKLPRLLEAVADLSGGLVAEAGPRLSLFIYSLLYGLSVSTSGCLPENLSGNDRRAVNLYADLLRSLLIEVLASRGSRGLASIEARARLVEREYGETAYALAALIGSVGVEPARRMVEEAARLQQRAWSLGERIAKLLGGPAPPRQASPAKVFSEVEGIYSLLEKNGYTAVAGVAGSCSTGIKGIRAPRIVALLLGIESYRPEENPEDLAELAEKLLAYSRRLPRHGVLAEAARLAEEAASLMEEVGSSGPAQALARLVMAPFIPAASRLVEELASLGRVYERLEAELAALPEALRRRAEEAVASDLSNVKSLSEAMDYLAKAVSLVGRLRTLSEQEGPGIEDLKNKIISLIDSIISDYTQASYAGQEAREEALAG
ncbi:hypothetical protein CF15_00515 [Pyrodictium occultum]|uniref:Uncharacterized protein n=1 Tax=Pyrodictium occultum TaxID=2309 RepID=A0A0V8RTJ8_PYROC|nr:ATP-binding protein [Pyrodictium occultum]KSW11383.1 hypothetical protein CF15_00515 [Pyrodictium occultum]